ncbi:uncharacterized protein LOC123424479 [Hordeum vulgare subsp. vulgare]|uniref:FBD domain-containing protein n=1 Tax=Hordeum vulgare subsp. vulgare TaxID=112509 RepID=A0A8I7B4L7_HORVV|nr:uncharacterized protein LOC123424479 [Hordeum vulgare subsp. vulgare]
MAGPRHSPFTNVDPSTEDDLRRKGLDPQEVDRSTEQLLTYICTELVPALPASDGVILNDAHLRPKGSVFPPTPADSPAIVAAVSTILEAHTGPIPHVRLTSSHTGAYQAQLARWLQLLATRGVQELVLVNRPWPLDVPLPAALFGIASLACLYIGLWKFPDVAGSPRSASFPRLRELGLCSVVVEDGDIDFVVAQSPVLETLNIHGSSKGLRLGLVSQSLRCVQICGSALEDIAVVEAPRLERLILEGFRSNAGGLCTRVTIGDAPKLQALGMLEPGNTILEIGDTIGMASPGSMATSVKFLSLNVRFGNHSNAKMVPSFLACFPNLEALHIMSEKGDYEAGSARLNLNFWKLVKPTENIKSCIKVFSYKEFRGELGEVAFLKFFFRNARVLSTASVSMANPSFTSFSMDEATHKAQEASKKMASSYCEVVLLGSTGPEGGKPWSFKTGTDYSFEDPFSVVHIRHNA